MPVPLGRSTAAELRVSSSQSSAELLTVARYFVQPCSRSTRGQYKGPLNLWGLLSLYNCFFSWGRKRKKEEKWVGDSTRQGADWMCAIPRLTIDWEQWGRSRRLSGGLKAAHVQRRRRRHGKRFQSNVDWSSNEKPPPRGGHTHTHTTRRPSKWEGNKINKATTGRACAIAFPYLHTHTHRSKSLSYQHFIGFLHIQSTKKTTIR